MVNPLPTKPIISASGPLTFCAGGTVILTTNAAAGHRWSTGSLLNSITVTTAGSYADTAKSGGCKAVSDPVVIIINPLPTVNAGLDVSIVAGDSTTLTATGATTYLWSPLTALSPANGVGASVKAKPIQTTLYTVTGTNANGCIASDAVLVTVTGGTGPLTAPVISPSTGTYDGIQTVTIATTSPGAEIYYTTSGNVPVVGTVFTKLYTGSFQVLQSTTVRAIAVKSGQANSPVAVSFITITNPGICAVPVIAPNGGTFEGGVDISLTTTTSGAQIYFTLNGNSPVVGSSFTRLYTGPFRHYQTSTLKALAFKTGLANSPVAVASFVVNNPALVAAPTFSPGPGLFSGPQSITLSTTTANAQIYFTTNGNVPRLDVPNSFTKLYTGPFVLNQSATVRAIAVRTNWLQSITSVGIYSLGAAREAVSGTLEESTSEFEPLVFPNPSVTGLFNLVLPEIAGEVLDYTVLSVEGKKLEDGAVQPGETHLINLERHPAGLYILKMRIGNQVFIKRLSRL